MSTEREKLRRLVALIVRAQGNRFVKELLRKRGIALGANKKDFEQNLKIAIDNGKLKLSDVQAWLEDVEGWGNQHVYMYGLSDALLVQLDRERLYQNVLAARLKHAWEASTIHQFPDDQRLTSISFDGNVLRLIWQKATPSWTRVEEKDKKRTEGLDDYWYRAHRLDEQRTVTRFEAHVDRRLAGLFLPQPVQGEEHKIVYEAARTVIGLLLDLPELEANQLDMAIVSKNMDQQNMPVNNGQRPPVQAQRSRLISGGAYVEFAASSSDMSYHDEPAIQDVRNAVRDGQLDAFQGGEGVFWFEGNGTDLNLTRRLRVQLYGEENRLRLWARMEAAEVWDILTHIAQYR
jgi:hypothetical protein